MIDEYDDWKHCGACGGKMIEVDIHRYNRITGKKLRHKLCENYTAYGFHQEVWETEDGGWTLNPT